MSFSHYDRIQITTEFVSTTLYSHIWIYTCIFLMSTHKYIYKLCVSNSSWLPFRYNIIKRLKLKFWFKPRCKNIITPYTPKYVALRDWPWVEISVFVMVGQDCTLDTTHTQKTTVIIGKFNLEIIEYIGMYPNIRMKESTTKEFV